MRVHEVPIRYRLQRRGDADIALMRNGVAFKPDHWNIHLTTFAENQPTPSGKQVALFDLREVRELMEGKG